MTEEETLLRNAYDIMHIFGDKWTIPVMVALSDGPLRPSEILMRVNSFRVDENWPDRHAVLHDSILARSLTRMTTIGLLNRTQVEAFPPKVHYALEPPAVDFLELLEPAFGWPRGNSEVVVRAQVFHLARKMSGEPPTADEHGPGAGRVRATTPAAGRRDGATPPAAPPRAAGVDGPGRERPHRGSAGPSFPDGARGRVRGPVGPR